MTGVFHVVTTKVNPRNGENLYMLFETAHDSLDSLTADLNDGLVVSGFRLWTKYTTDEKGKCLEVTQRDPVAITRRAVVEIMPPSMRLVAFVDEPTATAGAS